MSKTGIVTLVGNVSRASRASGVILKEVVQYWIHIKDNLKAKATNLPTQLVANPEGA